MSTAEVLPTRSNNLEVALHHARAGLFVFPCKPDKLPYIAGGFKSAAIDELQIRRWWKQFPNALVGIACEQSRLVVLDCDVKNGIDGVANFNNVAAECGFDPRRSPSVGTPSGGAHCYFATPDGWKPSNRPGGLPPGIDVRSAGYVFAPGSVLPDGGRYAALPGMPDLATAYRNKAVPVLPDGLRVILAAKRAKEGPPAAAIPGPVHERQPSPSGACAPATEREIAYAAKALEAEATDLANRPPGSGRNDALNNAALAMGEMVGAGWISGSAVEASLRQACGANGWLAKDGDQAFKATLRSGLEAGMRQPRAPLANVPLIDFSNLHVNGVPVFQQAPHGGQPLPSPAANNNLAAAPDPLWRSADFALKSHQGYVVKHLIAPGNVCALLGQPGAGKSTLAPHLAYAVAQGRRVFGMRTRRGPVLYIAAEDYAGVKKRLYALGEKHGHSPDCAAMESGNLRDPARQAVIAATLAAFNPVLVVLDTVAAAFAGMDENASQDMGVVVAWTRSIAATGAAVLLVHHPAKQGDGTARGHGSLNGTLDMSMTLACDDMADPNALVRGSLAKNRNGTTARTLAFRKEVVPLGEDDEGDRITTTLPVEVEAEEGRPAAPLPRLPTEALKVLQQLAANADDGKVPENVWRETCDEQRVSTSGSKKTRNEAFTSAYARLRDDKFIIVGEDKVWLPITQAEGGGVAECGGIPPNSAPADSGGMAELPIGIPPPLRSSSTAEFWTGLATHGEQSGPAPGTWQPSKGD